MRSNRAWVISESLVLEIDILLSFLSGYWAEELLSDSVLEMIQKMPEDYKNEIKNFGINQPHFIWIFHFLGVLTGLEEATDYQNLSLIFRKMTLRDIRAKLINKYPKLLTENQDQSDLEFVSESANLIENFANKAIGLDGKSPDTAISSSLFSSFLNNILQGGEFQHEFWHWLDRCMYEFYLPWRQKNSENIEQQRKFARHHLAKLSKNEIPELDWLHDRIPLTARPQVIKGLTSLNCSYHFVCTPYLHMDFIFTLPGYCALSLAEPAWIQEVLKDKVTDLSKTVRALSDPTRLMILRCIRSDGLYTTELASFLNLSRPTISEHCKILRMVGLIDTYTEGRKSFHRLKAVAVNKVFGQIKHFLDINV